MIETATPVRERVSTPSLKTAALIAPPRPERRGEGGFGGALLRGAIAVPLVALAVALILSGLLPAVLVAMVAFLPALAPLIMVGVGILATARLQAPEEHRICNPDEPCCCGLHDDGERKPGWLA